MRADQRRAAVRYAAATRACPLQAALLLGRLAVDHRYAGFGIGTTLVAHVLATAVELNAKAACRAVVVTALHARARSWWELLCFRPFHPDDPTATDLYLLTSEIEATLDALGQ